MMTLIKQEEQNQMRNDQQINVKLLRGSRRRKSGEIEKGEKSD